MESPLLYLTLCSIRNRLRVRLRRLREVRYLAGLIVGVAYFALVFLRPRSGTRRGAAGAAALIGTAGAGQLLEAGAGLLLFVFVMLVWIWPTTRAPALNFSRADVQFLFTAPIARRRLIRYKVLRSQIGALLGSAIVTFLFRPATLAQGWTFFLGLALVMATLNLHLTGVSLSRAHVRTPGATGLLRRWAPLAVASAALVAFLVSVSVHWADMTAEAARGGNMLAEVVRLTTTGVTGAVLWPFRAIARLTLAGSPAAFLAALPWTLAALAINYVWVLRSDVPFEEASAELSERIAKIRTQGFQKPRAPRPAAATPFTLALEGPAEGAILWKNLILMGRFLSWKTLLRFAPLIVILASILGRGGRSASRADALATLCVIEAMFAVTLGPQIVRSDLRRDLPNLAVLKTWPIRGATLVRGEILAPAIVLTSLAWLGLVSATALSPYTSAAAQLTHPWAYLSVALAIAPGLILLQLLAQNALAVTFPSWVSVGAPRGGVDVMGQRMLLMAGSLLALVISVLPAAIVAGATALAWSVLAGTTPIVLPGILAAGVLLAEAVLASELVGSILDRTDLTALDPMDT